MPDFDKNQRKAAKAAERTGRVYVHKRQLPTDPTAALQLSLARNVLKGSTLPEDTLELVQDADAIRSATASRMTTDAHGRTYLIQLLQQQLEAATRAQPAQTALVGTINAQIAALQARPAKDAAWSDAVDTALKKVIS